jgi:hypothetical protein
MNWSLLFPYFYIRQILRRMRNFIITLVFSLFVGTAFSQQSPIDNQMEAREFNFTSFNSHHTDNTVDAELQILVPDSFRNHPEYGKLPFNCGLDTVIELIDRRDEFSRTLVKKGTEGKIIYVQKGYFPLHYRDANGWWRTIDEYIHADSPSGLFTALDQPCPTSIDANAGLATVSNGTTVLRFNRNIELFFEDPNGNRTSLGQASWTNYTAGSEGVKVIDAWAGIDIEMIVSGGKIKTNYIVKNPMQFSAGWLVFEDHPDLPAGMTANFVTNQTDAYGLNYNPINVLDANNLVNYTLGQAIGYDHSGNLALNQNFGCKLGASNEWQIYVPTGWIGNTSLVFPLVIDPLVSTTGTLLQAAITGSYQEPTGLFTSSCNYNLTVATPANCTITNILASFTYVAQNGAVLCQGATKYTYGACVSPAGVGFYWFCNNCVFAGTCTGTNTPLFADFTSCVPAPQCVPYNMAFTLQFFARSVTAGACSNFFIGAGSNWVMTIEGQTVAQPVAPVSSNGTTICLGTSTTLTANGQYGVPGYTYLWNPGALTTQSITVSPAATTTYTCTITDACGQTAINTITITVNTANTLTPLPTFSIALSPPSGTPCPVTATVTYTGTNNYGGGAETYQWSFGGSSSIIGVTSGSANAPPYGGPYTVVYNTAGTYALSVTIFKGGLCATTTQTIIICAVLPVEMLSFDATYKPTEAGTQLNWITASESNNSRFIVERSTDGSTIEEVGVVYTKAIDGNSIEQISYDYFDATVLTEGFYYYRLKQIDENGTYEYTDWKVVEVHPSQDAFFARPTITTDKVMVGFYSTGKEPAQMTITDSQGKIVYQSSIVPTEGMNLNQLDVHTYTEGVYYIHISNGEKEYNGRFVKQ